MSENFFFGKQNRLPASYFQIGGAPVQGLAAISANNGWTMALIGACIVMTGLATLSFIISQLHRIIEIIEKKTKPAKITAAADSSMATIEPQRADRCPLADLEATAIKYQPLTSELGESFQLAELLRIMETRNLPHPHITMRELRSSGYLVPLGEGTFRWTKT